MFAAASPPAGVVATQTQSMRKTSIVSGPHSSAILDGSEAAVSLEAPDRFRQMQLVRVLVARELDALKTRKEMVGAGNAVEGAPIDDEKLAAQPSKTKVVPLDAEDSAVAKPSALPAAVEGAGDASFDKESVRHRVFVMFDDPESGPWAKAANLLILFLIALSTVTLVIETEPSLQSPSDKAVFYALEVFAISIFSLEYLTKLVVSYGTWNFFKKGMNLVDLVAIMPFYLEIIVTLTSAGSDNDSSGMGVTRILRVVRLVRIFRVLRLGRAMDKIVVVGSALRESADVLGMFMFLVFLALIFFSTLVYFAEKDAPDADGNIKFESISISFWWSLVTLFTVGYGDMVPQTVGGMFVGTLTMASSILILALPISVIGANFQTKWNEKKNENEEKQQFQGIAYDIVQLSKSLRTYNNRLSRLNGSFSSKVRSLDNSVLQQVERLKQDLEKKGTMLSHEEADVVEAEVSKAVNNFREVESGSAAINRVLWGDMRGLMKSCLNEYGAFDETLRIQDLVNADFSDCVSVIRRYMPDSPKPAKELPTTNK